MIYKLKDGMTIVRLGNGTVRIGIAKGPEDNRPIGIYFTNGAKDTPIVPEESILIQITNEKALGSYLNGLVLFAKELNNDDNGELAQEIRELEKTLKPLLPDYPEDDVE